MPLTETVVLNIASAQRQIDELEADLRRLSQPINVPVDVEGGRAADELRQDFSQADTAVANLNNELEETGRELQTIDRRSDDASEAILRVGTRGTSAFTSLKGSIIGVGAAFAAIAGARAFLGFAGEAISAASDLAESTSKAEVVFGDFTDQIKEFASTAPQALGLANAEALEFAGTFGNLFVALGLGQQEAAGLSTEIVQLGSDLASFNNIEVTDALDKLRAGLVGEAEPLRVLGVNINEALTQAKAMELGLVGLNGELSEAAKVQARYALIVEQTATAQGDFARTADGVANRQRTLTAEFKNLQAAIGEALLPAFEALLDAGPAIIGAVEGLIPVFANLANTIAGIDTTEIGDFVQTLSAVPTVFDTAGTAITGFADIAAGISPVMILLDGNFSRVGAGVERLSNAVDQFNLAKLRNGLINSMQAGINPALAFADALVVLGSKGLDLDQLSAGAGELANIAGLDTSGLAAMTRLFVEQGEAVGLEAEEVQTLVNLFRDLAFEQEGFQRRSPGGGDQRIVDPFALIGEANRAIETAIGQIDAFRLLGPQVADDIQQSLDRVALAEVMEPFAERFATAVSGSVSDSLKDEEGELETSAEDFVARFVADVEEALLFEENLRKIREAGGELLAASLAQEGPENAGQLAADFLLNPSMIDAFEGAAVELGVKSADAELEAFLATIVAADFSAVPVPAVTIPLVFGDFPAFPTFPQLTGSIPPTSGGGQGGFGPQSITNNFFTEPAPTTDTQRITQSTAAITGTLGARGPQ